MKTRMMTTATAVMAASVAFAQNVWDSDADGAIDREEFRAALTDKPFGTWDANDDGLLSPQEFEDAVESQPDASGFRAWDEFLTWDTNQDQMLSYSEYDIGLWARTTPTRTRC